jgi:hypothetical protein
MVKLNSSFLKGRFIGLCLFLNISLSQAQQEPKIIRLEFNEADEFVDYDFVNVVTGWNDYFNAGYRGGTSSIGLLEAGQAWFGHEVFIRPPNSPSAFTTWNNPTATAINEIDYHATTVAHVLAGSGYVPTNGGAYTLVGLGMAPEARLVSGGIATSFSSDVNNLGSFDISTESIIPGYKEFFRGTTVGKLDVINSSWGGNGAANSPVSLSLDGLAFQNSSVAHVISAGNGDIAEVSSPANGFNNISVGSLGGNNFDEPSTFSSRGLSSFYNPVTSETIVNARVAVDIAAPGENLYLAAYLGNSGSIGAIQPNLAPGSNLIAQEPPPTNLYFTALSGTSYSAPVIAGGIALLKDAARGILGGTPVTNPDTFDTRTIKSVIMAGSEATVGWNNGQDTSNITSQALDTTTGAGSLNLLGAAGVYFGQTRGVNGVLNGNAVGVNGWLLTTVDLGKAVEFVINRTFDTQATITVALNWFAVRGFDDINLGEDIAFANLDLEVWKLDSNDNFIEKVGSSQTTYNNTEFLRISNLSSGQYGMRVLFKDKIYDTTGLNNTETFALAWTSIPEPNGFILIVCGSVFLFCYRRR